MKINNIIKSFLFPLMLLLYLSGCSTDREDNVLEPAEFEQSVRALQNAQLIDVRTAEEFESGHIGGAVNMNFYEDNFRDQIKQLDNNKPVYVYCRSGVRSSKASQILKEEGFGKVYDLKGGIINWDKAGLKLIIN